MWRADGASCSSFSPSSNGGNVALALSFVINQDFGCVVLAILGARWSSPPFLLLVRVQEERERSVLDTEWSTCAMSALRQRVTPPVTPHPRPQLP